MRTSYCKQNKMVTIRLSEDEFYTLKNDTENDSPEMVWEIIGQCDNAMSSATRTNTLVGR